MLLDIDSILHQITPDRYKILTESQNSLLSLSQQAGDQPDEAEDSSDEAEDQSDQAENPSDEAGEKSEINISGTPLRQNVCWEFFVFSTLKAARGR